MTKLNSSELNSQRRDLLGKIIDLSDQLWEKFPELAKLEESPEEEWFKYLTLLAEEERDTYFALKRAIRALNQEFMEVCKTRARSSMPSFLRSIPRR